ncbi:MAG: molybdate ABC transporter substrate-binding protein [Thermovirgaceae bacterium]
MEVFGNMRKVVAALMLLALFVSFGIASTPAAAETEPLLVYCGAGLMKPMDELKATFEERTGTKVRMIYAGSGELFGMISTRQEGDVYIPGDIKYTTDALEKEIVVEDGMENICYHVPVILTPAGNPGKVESLEDLGKEGLKIALADEKAAAIGKVSIAVLKKNGLLDAVNKNVVTKPSTTNQLLIYTATGQVDATIAWEDQALWGEGEGKIEVIRIPSAQNLIKTIPASVVTFSKRPQEATSFIRFISSKEGKAVWAKWGFPITEPE